MTATRPPGYDDRSAAPVEASRRGAHRARPKAIAAILPVVAGVAVVLLVLGAVYTVVGGRSDSPTKSAAEVPLEEGGEPAASASAGAGGGKKPVGEETTAAEETADPANGGGAKADKTIPLVVLNSLNVSGLAGKYQRELEGKGWTVERIDDATQKDLSVTKIYYQDAEQKPTATALRKALGLGQISEDPGINPGNLTVVLGQDTQ